MIDQVKLVVLNIGTIGDIVLDDLRLTNLTSHLGDRWDDSLIVQKDPLIILYD